MAKLETVEVDRNGTKVIINKSDFDPDRDKLFGGKAAPQSEPVTDELAEEYERLYGKKPHHKMKLENIKAAIENAEGND